MAYLILVFGLLLNFAAFGSGLKCYSYSCSNQTGQPSASCSRMVANCSEYEDRCMTQRYKTFSFVAQLRKYFYLTQETGACGSYMSGQCHLHDYFCKALNSSGNILDCDRGCCQGDLCNNGYIPPRALEPKGSLSGSNLSCYSCATKDLLGINAPTKDCNRPVNVTCGNGRLSGMKHDRCMSVKAVFNINGFSKEVINMRGCSDPSFCNQDFACKSMNASGMIESCSMSCCFAKNCNGPGPIDKPTATSKVSSIPTAHSKIASIPTGPTGSDLSCYSCASKNNIYGLKVADADCKNPAKQTCSYTDLGGGRLKHDRCWRMSIDWANDNYQNVTNMEYRNCTSNRSLYCNKDYVCNAINKSGELKRCDVSCCTGDYCNGNPVATSPLSLSPLTTQSPLSLSPSTNSSQVALVSTRALLLIGLATVVLVH